MKLMRSRIRLIFLVLLFVLLGLLAWRVSTLYILPKSGSPVPENTLPSSTFPLPEASPADEPSSLPEDASPAPESFSPLPESVSPSPDLFDVYGL